MNSYLPKEKEELAELIKLRRMFHQNPEIGFTEFWTTARICEYLEPLHCQLLYGDKLKAALLEPDLLAARQNQLAYKVAAEKCISDPWIEKLQGITGLVAIIKGKKPGPKFGFRVDIDGLPIVESTENAHLPYREGFASSNGFMHACGHDGHMAIGMGLATRLAAAADKLSGEYYLLFQPAEEMIMGGKIFSTLNFIKDLNYFIPVHIGLKSERKIICGLSFLADKRYHVSFTGNSAHSAAFPEKGKNALLAACQAVTGLYGISRHSDGYSRINIGCFQSDNAVNIISDKVEFDLDLRGQFNNINEYLATQAENIIIGASKMQDVQCSIKVVTEGEAADNSPALMSQIRKACLDIGIPEKDIMDHYLISASEDACIIMNKVAKNGGLATYVCIGCPTYGGHHNEKFDFDEDVLLTGVKILHQFVQNTLEKQ